jgi:hypothetical protein
MVGQGQSCGSSPVCLVTGDWQRCIGVTLFGRRWRGSGGPRRLWSGPGAREGEKMATAASVPVCGASSTVVDGGWGYRRRLSVALNPAAPRALRQPSANKLHGGTEGVTRGRFKVERVRKGARRTTTWVLF